MQEEKASSQAVRPYNRSFLEVFDEWYDRWENPQLRLAPTPISENETVCLPKRDVARSCPNLLPTPPPASTPSPYCGVTPTLAPNQGAFGDEFTRMFGMFDDWWGDNNGQWGSGGGGQWDPPKQPCDGRIRWFPDGRSIVVDDMVIGPDHKNYAGYRAQLERCQPLAPNNWYMVPAPDSAGLQDVPPASATVRSASAAVDVRSDRGGAIGSIRYQNTELLEPRVTPVATLQVTATTNVPEGRSDQLHRANEAGASTDREGGVSSSRVLRQAQGGQEVYTQTRAAYWRAPASMYKGARVHNAAIESPFVMSKRVTASTTEPDVFYVHNAVAVPRETVTTSLKVATRLNLRHDMDRVVALTSDNQWVAVPRSKSLHIGQYRALAVSDATGSRAFGLTLVDFPRPPTSVGFRPKMYFALNVTGLQGRGTGVGLVHSLGVNGRPGAPVLTGTYAYRLAFSVGTLAAVSQKIATVVARVTNAASTTLKNPWSLVADSVYTSTPANEHPNEDTFDDMGDNDNPFAPIDPSVVPIATVPPSTIVGPGSNACQGNPSLAA